MKFYRLRSPKGEYASGGRQLGRATKQGKVFAGRGPFANHLAYTRDPLKYYKEFVVVVIDEEAQTFTETPFDIWYDEYEREKAKKGGK